MLLKYQQPVPGQQPTAGAGGLATMAMPVGPRIGALYVQLTVTKAAGGAGVYSMPLLTDIADPGRPIYVKIGGNIQINRLASEMVAMNTLQSDKALGSVQYFQGGVLMATVYNAANTAVPAALAANTATTAIFQVPIYLIEYWRKNLRVAESFAWPTAFTDGSKLPQVTIEVPLANNGGAVFSGHNCSIWWDYDTMVYPASVTTSVNGQNVVTKFTDGLGNGKPIICKKGRYTQLYAAMGNLNITPIVQKDRLLQFSLLAAAGDFISQVQVKLNGVFVKNVTKAQADQLTYDHEMNVNGAISNRFDVVFDINDDPNSGLPLRATDVLEIIATFSTVQAAAQLVVLTESYGTPD